MGMTGTSGPGIALKSEGIGPIGDALVNLEGQFPFNLAPGVSIGDADAAHGTHSIGTIASMLAEGQDEASFLSGGAVRTPMIFLDLETTGLSGGAGTLAFLVGCGWLDAGGFVTRP